MDSLQEFTVDAKSVNTQGGGHVRALVNLPSGQLMDTDVTDNKDGTYRVLYTPVEQGKYGRSLKEFEIDFLTQLEAVMKLTT